MPVVYYSRGANRLFLEKPQVEQPDCPSPWRKVPGSVSPMRSPRPTGLTARSPPRNDDAAAAAGRHDDRPGPGRTRRGRGTAPSAAARRTVTERPCRDSVTVAARRPGPLSRPGARRCHAGRPRGQAMAMPCHGPRLLPAAGGPVGIGCMHTRACVRCRTSLSLHRSPSLSPALADAGQWERPGRTEAAGGAGMGEGSVELGVNVRVIMSRRQNRPYHPRVQPGRGAAQ